MQSLSTTINLLQWIEWEEEDERRIEEDEKRIEEENKAEKKKRSSWAE